MNRRTLLAAIGALLVFLPRLRSKKRNDAVRFVPCRLCGGSGQIAPGETVFHFDGGDFRRQPRAVEYRPPTPCPAGCAVSPVVVGWWGGR